MWTDDRDRCDTAGIPSDRGFKTKPELAMGMLARALDAGVPARWVTGDAVYGQYYKLRKALEDRGVFYVLAVPMNQRVIAKTTARVPGGQWRADELITALPATAWRTRSAVPEYCLATPAERFPFFKNPVSSTINTPSLAPRCSTR